MVSKPGSLGAMGGLSARAGVLTPLQGLWRRSGTVKKNDALAGKLPVAPGDLILPWADLPRAFGTNDKKDGTTWNVSSCLCIHSWNVCQSVLDEMNHRRPDISVHSRSARKHADGVALANDRWSGVRFNPGTFIGTGSDSLCHL
jgi:hypothetical protein